MEGARTVASMETPPWSRQAANARCERKFQMAERNFNPAGPLRSQLGKFA
jgi:hypothetical protein